MSNARAACAHTCRRRGEGGRGVTGLQCTQAKCLWQICNQKRINWQGSSGGNNNNNNSCGNPRCVLMSGLCRVSTAWDLSLCMCMYICRVLDTYIHTARQYELISIKKGFSFVIRKLLLFCCCCCCCEWNASMNIKLSMEIWAIKWERDSNRPQSERASGQMAMREKLLHSLCCCLA